MRKINGLFTVDDLRLNQIDELFSLAEAFKKSQFKNITGINKVISLVFLEPSTRTKTSFEIAALRLGLKVSSFVESPATSSAKGESLSATLKTIQSMKPDLIVLRSPEDYKVKQCLLESNIVFLNAGFGSSYHPTQALLDAFTLKQHWGSFKGKKLVIVGDVAHSRVAASNVRLLSRLGVEVRFCGPELCMPQKEEFKSIQIFPKLDEALAWCDAVMSLRSQVERHSEILATEEITNSFQLNLNSIKNLKNDAVILHPGPFNEGIELDVRVLSNARCAIYSQVENGVYIRAALIKMFLGAQHD